MRASFVSRRNALLLVCLLLAADVEAHAASVTVVLPQVTGTSHAELKVPVFVKGAEGLGPLQMDLLFDPQQLKFLKAAEGSISGIGLFDFNVVEPGRVRLVMTGDPNKPIQGDGELFTVTLQANSSGNGRIVLKAENVRAWEQTLEALDMRVTVEPGAIELTSPTGIPPTGIPPWAMLAGVAVGIVLLFAIGSGLRRKPGGSTVPQATAHGRFCGSCGAPLPSDSKFCPSCGKPVGGS